MLEQYTSLALKCTARCRWGVADKQIVLRYRVVLLKVIYMWEKKNTDRLFLLIVLLSDANLITFSIPFSLGSCGIKQYAAGVSTSDLQRHLNEAHKVQSEKKPTGTDLKKFFSSLPRPRGSSNKNNLLARDFVLWLARDLLSFNLVDGVELQVT